MKQLFYRFIGVFVVGVMSMTSVAFSQYSFTKQNISAAPTLPGLNATSTPYDVSKANNPVDGTGGIIEKISGVINWVLGLLALVSIIILIYTGVKMLLNSSDDAAITEGYKTVKNIFIALLFIGASWLIIRFIFYIIALLV